MSDTPTIKIDETPEESSAKDTKDTRANAGPIAWFKKTFPTKPYTVLGALAGLILALLIFSIGFLKAIFVAICIAIGVAVGQYFDGNPKLITFVKRIFSDNRG